MFNLVEAQTFGRPFDQKKKSFKQPEDEIVPLSSARVSCFPWLRGFIAHKAKISRDGPSGNQSFPAVSSCV